MNQNINVNLIPKFAVVNLYFSQYDVGREAIVNLVNGSTEYEIPSGATVTLVATKPSGLGFTQNCTFEGNQITVVCTAEMTDEAGHFPCEIRIANGSLLLGTANFTFNVERSPHPEGTTDGTADSVINSITVAFENAMEQIENSGGLTSAIKNALLNCFQNVAWINDQGQTYYDALVDAFFAVTGITLSSNSLLFNSIGSSQQLTYSLVPSDSQAQVVWESSDTSVATVSNGLVTSVAEGNAVITASVGEVSATCSVEVSIATVTSLNAVLSGGIFYVGDPVDSIKPYLTVTATYSDSTSITVPSGSYTLSGSLSNAGANTITVSYEGVSTTVSVTAVQVELVSISAVYTQSGTVYDTDTLDSLKSDLVVTATYSDSSTETVPSADYTLSGTLTTGTSTITVSYGGKTDTFSVTVTHEIVPSGYTAYDYITMTISAGSNAAKHGIIAPVDTKSEYTYETKLYYESSNNATCNIFGTRAGSSGTKELGVFCTPSNGKLGYWYDGTDTSNTYNVLTRSSLNSIKILPVGESESYPLNAVINVDGTDYNTGSTGSGKTWSSWLGFFNYAISGTSVNQNATSLSGGLQIGETIIKDSQGNTIHDFIPAYNGTVYGLYERIGRQFYYDTTYSSDYTCGNWN